MVITRETALEDTDDAIEEMYQMVESNKDLKDRLKKTEEWVVRWATLERFVLGKLEDIGLDFAEYSQLWIRERFFYEMQKRSNLDYGFCPYFTPAFRERTESFLTENLKIDMSHKCTYGGETHDTTCSGTDRDMCVVLNREDEG